VRPRSSPAPSTVRSLVVLWLLFSVVLPGGHAQERPGIRVLTAMQSTYSLASALAGSTSIEVINIPEEGRSTQALDSWLERRGDRLAETFESADAVITIGRTWSGDPLYTATRDYNIRVVNIDASKPWSTTMSGVSLIRRPGSQPSWVKEPAPDNGDETASHFWMSYANAIRMADIIASDLKRLVPDAVEQISSNQAELKRQLLAERSALETVLLGLDDNRVFALADEFVYLTNEFGIFVDGYFIRQDIQWTPGDLASFSAYLKDNGIRVVVHKWEPSDEIKAAINAAGARLAVLNTGDPGLEEDSRLAVDGYQRILQQNVRMLIDALADTAG
jgi:ABC-type Zn uptake system ZnuABC Zn-binding protein ZnuA